MTGRGGAALGFLLLAVTGCTRLPPSTQPPATSVVAMAGDPDAFVELLRKTPDLATCRSVLQQLNDLQARTPTQAVESLSADQAQQLRRQLHLDPDELAEVQSTSFTPLDAHYLEQCLLFHDAARALELDKLPPAARAQAAFDWTMRQVRLSANEEEPAPPGAVLRRGWGSDWERALVFLALLDQLGLRGGLAYIPDTSPRQCLAVAVVEGSPLVFDPRLGVQRSDQRVAVEAVETVCTLSAVAPRMRRLEGILQGRVPVRLARTLDGTPSQPNSPRAPHRLQRAFLVPEEGGADQARRRHGRFELAVTPWAVLPREVQEIPPHVELGERLRGEFEQPFLEFLLRPNAPRDLLLRGRYADAVARLVSARDDLRNYRALLQENPKLREGFVKWCADARAAQQDLLLAQRQAADKTPGSAAQLTQAQARMEAQWKEWSKARPVMMEAAAGPLHAKSTFHLALAKHEQAEQLTRAGAKTDLTPAQRAAWQSAAEWWGRYLDEAPSSPAVAAARLNQARALDALGDTAGAIAVLEVAMNLPPADQAAVSQRLQQLKGR